MAKVVILGAGLTGLSTAYHLEKQGFYDFSILEKNETPGGLARSVTHNGFTFDYTGHLLHCNNEYFCNFLKEISPDNSLYNIKRNSFVYSHHKCVPYPFQMNLHGLPEQVIIECLVGFAKRKHQLSAQNFQNWALKHFGTGIAKHFFIPYNKKILAYDITKITSSWIGNFIPRVTLQDILKGIVEEHDSEVGYNHIFHYPKTGGIQTFVNNIVAKIKNPVKTNYQVALIDLKQKIISCTNGHTERFDSLISTIPLNTFLSLSHQPAQKNFTHTQQHLLCNAVVNFNLGFHHHDIGDKHWVYVPETQYPFYRFGFWHNFSSAMVPHGKTSLFGELSYMPGKKSTAELQDLTTQAITKMLNILNLTTSDIATTHMLSLPHAYVIYNNWREQHLNNLLRALNEISVHSIGRYGAWKYSSMQDAILDGKHAAAKIIQTIQNKGKQTVWHIDMENISNETQGIL